MRYYRLPGDNISSRQSNRDIQCVHKKNKANNFAMSLVYYFFGTQCTLVKSHLSCVTFSAHLSICLSVCPSRSAHRDFFDYCATYLLTYLLILYSVRKISPKSQRFHPLVSTRPCMHSNSKCGKETLALVNKRKLT